MSYVIKETRRYYGPTTDYAFVTDPADLASPIDWGEDDDGQG